MVFAIYQHELATGIYVWYLCFLLCCLGVIMHLLFTQAAWFSVFQNLKHQSLFHCFSPNASTDPQGVPWFLGVPSLDMKVRSWLVCKATFKCVTHKYKPMRAWQPQFLMPACLCKEQSSTWSQCSRHVGKISRCDQGMDVPLNKLHSWIKLTPQLCDHWSLQIMLQPIPVFPCCLKISQEPSSPLQSPSKR